MLNKYLESRTDETPKSEQRYMLFLLNMRDALGEKEANKLFEKAQSEGKKITLKYVEGVIDGEVYTLTDK